ncbi:hypothetical protein MAR_023865 [Mya arenaria]|uniref:Death domain-containing protein n=1 Tax=Mya arenaria TaxID=6604 RepID=A0ABY7DP78_MYAAR|nr:uncharacterized protein LOC128228247 isoform X1 [Mya arenaria]WAQ99492.1 hypothetical protein MAR_023865 [Mya arenaria]
MYWNKRDIIFSVSVICFILIEETKSNEIQCNAQDNYRWKSKLKKCVRCRDCPSGKARNFTEEYTGKRGLHGDEECLKCHKCGDGYYVHIPEFGGIPGTCVTCSSSCADRNRLMEQECGKDSNWRCGGCIFRYTDYGASNTDLPCYIRKEYTQSTTNLPESNNSSTKVPPENDTNAVMVLLACVGMTIFIFAVLSVLCVRHMRRSKLTTPVNDLEVRNQDKYIQIHQHDNDIECDCAGDVDSGRIGFKLAHYENSDERVRAELLSNRGQRGQELSNPLSGTETFDNLHKVCKQLSEYWSSTRKRQQVCECILDTSCEKCEQLLHYVEDVSLMDKGVLLKDISGEICHDPLDLFKALGVKDSDIYSLDDDRNRNVDQIPQSEFIYRVLKKWVEVNAGNARLHDLIKALCKGRFHTINENMFEDDRYNYITLQDSFPSNC